MECEVEWNWNMNLMKIEWIKVLMGQHTARAYLEVHRDSTACSYIWHYALSRHSLSSILTQLNSDREGIRGMLWAGTKRFNERERTQSVSTTISWHREKKCKSWKPNQGCHWHSFTKHEIKRLMPRREEEDVATNENIFRDNADDGLRWWKILDDLWLFVIAAATPKSRRWQGKPSRNERIANCDAVLSVSL